MIAAYNDDRENVSCFDDNSRVKNKALAKNTSLGHRWKIETFDTRDFYAIRSLRRYNIWYWES